MSAAEYEVGRQPGPPTRKRVEVDPITLRVLGGAFHATAKEMAGVLFRMSYSSIIRESEDLGAGIFDAQGRELCESDSTPMHIGSLPWYIRGFLHRLGDTIEDGDVIVHNHPYLGASHSPDVAVAVPIFHEGELLGFAAVTAHVLDVGGSFPGINADAFDVYAEAKLYNALRWYRRGELNEDLDQMIFDNVRTETMNRGDMNAMLAACRLGKERFLRLVDRYGVEVVMSAAYDWMDYSERMLRSEIEKIPDGTYGPVIGWLDDDARNRDVQLRVETRVIVEGDEITIDLTGSNPEVATGFNVPFEGSLLVSCYYAVRTILLDEVTFPEHVPQNDGVFRPVKVIAPKGTIFNPTFPRACFSRFCQTQRVVDNINLALADALPDKVTGGNSAGIHFCAYAGFDEGAGEYWLYLEVNEGAYGGRSGKDAMDSVDNLMANTRNNPIEELDMRFPMRCDQYELRPEPAAPGKWRGGVGIIRRNRFLVDGTYSCEGDRQTDPPQGIFGAWDGLVASCRKNPDTPREEQLPAKVTGYPFAAGEFIEFREPNAAGYGDPLERDPLAVREDVLDDFTTIELARDAYGVVFADERTLEIDECGDGGPTRRAARAAPQRLARRLLLRSRSRAVVRAGFRGRKRGVRDLKAYEVVAERLRAEILDGARLPGMRFANELDLAEEHGVSRATIREALRLLGAENLIRTTKGAGGGSFVTVPSASDVSESLRSGLGRLASAEHVTLDELVEARALLEVPAAQLAARRRGDDDLARLRESIPGDPLRLGANEQFIYNRDFHTVVIEACGNTMLAVAAQPIFDVLRTHLSRSSLGRVYHRAINDHHRGLADAIEAHDEVAAGEQMREHLEFLRPYYERAWRAAARERAHRSA